MSELVLGPASVIVDGAVAGWLAQICTEGAQATIDAAKRDSIVIPFDAIAETIDKLRQAGRIASASASTNWANGASASVSFNPAENPSPLLSTCDAARRLGVSTTWVRHLASSGVLGTKVGNAWTFTEREIDDYAEADS